MRLHFGTYQASITEHGQQHIKKGENTMMTLYGASSCTSCKQAMMLLNSHGIQYQYVDVNRIAGYEGEIPALQLDNGQTLYGLGQINSYFRNQRF